MIYSKEFLTQLVNQQSQILRVRVTVLTFDELPIQFIEGYLTSGSINIDGDSAIRRTCQLSISTEQNVEYVWALNTKMRLEVGVKYIDQFVWFPQGIYIITSFSSAQNINGFIINISGKDKMCQLNGDNGGLLPHEVDFGQMEEVDANGNVRIIKNTLKDIILEAVHHYGGEPFQNIIINDLDNRGFELQEYKYDTPLFLLRKSGESQYIQGTLSGDMEVIVVDGKQETTLGELNKYDILIDNEFMSAQEGQVFYFKNDDNKQKWVAAKITYGQTIGYTVTELVFFDKLVGSAGASITSILDKIVQMLGNFEYFYDIDGKFIFQEKPNYLNTSWSPLVSNEEGLVIVDPGAEKTQFDFMNTALFTSIANTPNITELKNDYTVCGIRKGIDGNEIKIHMRYAIDKKPTSYTTIAVTEEELQEYNKKYNLKVSAQESKTYSVTDNYDWRELIYRMALDYNKYHHLDIFYNKVAAANPDMIYGQTGYEQYYIDLQGFWRQLYCPNAAEQIPNETYYQEGPYQYWNKKVYEAPEQLNFWFDFLDSNGELSKYSVQKIGQRAKVVNDNSVKAIYYLKTPEIIYTPVSTDVETTTDYAAYTKFNINENYAPMFSQSTQGKTAKEVVDNLLYTHSYCVESVNISSIPLYFLEPNKRIYIKDQGEYIPTKISFQLSHSSLMTLTAVKAIERII